MSEPLQDAGQDRLSSADLALLLSDFLDDDLSLMAPNEADHPGGQVSMQPAVHVAASKPPTDLEAVYTALTSSSSMPLAAWPPWPPGRALPRLFLARSQPPMSDRRTCRSGGATTGAGVPRLAYGTIGEAAVYISKRYLTRLLHMPRIPMQALLRALLVCTDSQLSMHGSIHRTVHVTEVPLCCCQ
jgi:hypothetical protein